MQWTLEQVAHALGARLPEGAEAGARLSGVSIDSRTACRGNLFVAIHGARHDGHSFVPAALRVGAVAAVVARDRLLEFAAADGRRILAVEDTLRALQRLALLVCREWKAGRPGRRVAAVTGSAGKTTTKEILAALLGTRFRVLKSEGNLNNEYGLPLTLMRLEDEHEAAVVEVGMSRRGELATLAAIAEPEVGVVTNVAPVHLEFFSSVDEIALAKRELIDGIRGGDPVAVLNADDLRVARFEDVFRGRVLHFGFDPEVEFRAENIQDRGIAGTAFDFVSPIWRARLDLPLAGRHNLANALAALAASSEWEIRADWAREALRGLQPPEMRGQVLNFSAGFSVYSDCYNSNPLALERVIELAVAATDYRRRILVAGEMRELGPDSSQWHRSCGQAAARSGNMDWIIGVAGDAAALVRAAVEAGHDSSRARFFPAAAETAVFLAGIVGPGDLVIVKGSRGVHLEQIVEELRRRDEQPGVGHSPAGDSRTDN
jgi:UDP-N-acetylmuramoyl-tripeptide--D-alanyl-D-alanine ligase